MTPEQNQKLKQLKAKYRWKFIQENFIIRLEKLRFDDWGYSQMMESIRSHVNLLKYTLKHSGRKGLSEFIKYCEQRNIPQEVALPNFDKFNKTMDYALFVIGERKKTFIECVVASLPMWIKKLFGIKE